MAEIGGAVDENGDRLLNEDAWAELMLLEWENKLSEWAFRSGSGVVGGCFNSKMALAIRFRLPKAATPISVLSNSRSSSRRTSPVMSCSAKLGFSVTKSYCK